MFKMFIINLRRVTGNDFTRVYKNIGFNCTGYPKSLSERNASTRRCYITNQPYVKSNEIITKRILLNRIPIEYLPKRPASIQTKKPQKSLITWSSFLVSLGVGSIFIAYALYLRDKKRQLVQASNVKQVGKARMGGDFELLNQYNQPIKNSDLLGKWLLVYFGFTHCPDVCPDEIEKIVKVVDEIDSHYDKKNMVRPVFISVDPERDSPSAVGKYLKEFSSKFLGLTGTQEQIDKACKAYRVYYSAGPRDSDNDYIVDHTIITYFIGPDGEFIDYYNQATSPEKMAKSVLQHMNKHMLYRPKGLMEKFWALWN